METKNLIIICTTIVLAVIIVLSAFIYVNAGNETSLSSNIADTLQNGDEITLKLIDKNNNPLANKTISLTIDNGKTNTTNELTTNEKGEVKYKLNLTEGTYALYAVYNGDIFSASSRFSKKFTIEKESQETDSNPDKSAKTKTYSDWQKDYETGRYDEDGNPIYRSVMSTSGGQYEPGIYESYWSANGPISERRIG